MVVSQMAGGLGNQMFQYAAGYALSRRLGTPYKMDASRYDWDQYRKFEINTFKVTAPRTSKLEQVLYSTSTKFPVNKLPKALHPIRQFKEKSFAYDSRFESISGNLYLVGTWHSHKYFDSCDYDVRREFRFKNKLSKPASDLARHMGSSTSVFIHVRRGDYINSTKFSKFFPVQSIEYYQQAIAQIESQVKKPMYFIFSDDMKWCRKNLFIKKAMFVSEITKSGLVDLQLMSHCNHAIIANSSFSWWGAWLITKKNKHVVAPKTWFQDKTIITKDIYPSGWTVL